MCESFARIKWGCGETGAAGISEKVFPLHAAQRICKEFDNITRQRGGLHVPLEVNFALTEKTLPKFTEVNPGECDCYEKLMEKMIKPKGRDAP